MQDQAARAFDPGAGRDGEEAREREVEKLHAKIGQLTVEREVRKMSAPDRRALLDPMAVWRAGVAGDLGDKAVDMTLRLDDVVASSTYPQPQQLQCAA